jgi:uncharacterized protein (TIGR01777 family)
VSGASGFIGRNLVPFLKKEHEIFTLVRDKSKVSKNTLFWDPESMRVETDLDFDAAINLSGENVGNGRWTKNKKEAILNSRLMATNTLARFFSFKRNPPKLVINASATGYYGSRGDKLLTETSKKGEGFLANVCDEWERALLPIKDRGIRTVFLRTGIVLGKDGGVLKRLKIPFKLYLGGIIGDGSQYMSWIDIDDFVHAVGHIINNHTIAGPVNMVSPNPVTNKVFTNEFAKSLQRPAPFPVPKGVIKFLLGQMGEELLLASQKVVPEVLLHSGYTFRYPTIDSSLENQHGI